MSLDCVDKLEFTKMHGLGNDFMVVDATKNKFKPSLDQLKKWSDRNFGVGFDQFLLVETSVNADFKYRIFNRDGSEVEQCGNGARCFAKFVTESGLTTKNVIKVETMSGIIILSIDSDSRVVVDMGNPNFIPQNIPLNMDYAEEYSLDILGESRVFSAVSLGNPHAVLVVSSVATYPVLQVGKLIEPHSVFPNKVNVGFMEILDVNNIKLRVFERGSGETLACGSGACAAAVTGIKRNLLISPVKVIMSGGELNITWDGDHIFMTGDANTVFKGCIDL